MKLQNYRAVSLIEFGGLALSKLTNYSEFNARDPGVIWALPKLRLGLEKFWNCNRKIFNQ